MREWLGTYPFWSEQCHTDDHPASLASTESKCLVDLQGIHDLERHNGGVPISEVLGGAACRPMAKGLNRQEIQGVGESLAVELGLEEGGRSAHGVDQYQCWFPWVDGAT